MRCWSGTDVCLPLVITHKLLVEQQSDSGCYPHVGEISFGLMLPEEQPHVTVTLHLQGLSLGPDVVKNVISFGCFIMKKNSRSIRWEALVKS